MGRQYFVYIATNKWGTVLYTGVTNDIKRRMYEHKQKLVQGFTAHYRVDRLVYCVSFDTPEEAIAVEKKIKGWTRQRKTALIREQNSELRDLLQETSV